ncbi:MAG: Glutamate--tRNA ligase [Thermoleophilia bacterium]|nr:Glutamate--tRNA ligase [Thermoleophilia bacterium]
MASGHDGRFAPSPTGPLHLGNLRTALVAWLVSRAHDGRFLLRVDDLDPDRSRPEHEVSQLDDLLALGIDWDGDLVRQSDRLARYDDALSQLDAQDLTYPCFCTRAEVLAAAAAPHGPGVEAPYPGTCARLARSERTARVVAGEPHCIRVRAEAATIGFEDELLGRVETIVDDFVVRRRDGVAAYNLASPVDEADLAIDVVVRGADLAPTTPRQVWIAERLELHVPQFAHVPLVLGPDGARLAKRHGAASLDELSARGLDAAAVLALLAASIGIEPRATDTSARDLVDRFSIDRVPRGDERIDPARFLDGSGWSSSRIE